MLNTRSPLSTLSKNNFVHNKTQGKLTDGPQDNELHPKPDGFAANTVRFVEALQAHFPG